MILIRTLLPTVFALSMISAIIPASADGLLEKQCLAAGDSSEKCSCSQKVADEFLSPEEQEKFSEVAADPNAFFKLMSAADEEDTFLKNVTAFSEAVEQRCES